MESLGRNLKTVIVAVIAAVVAAGGVVGAHNNPDGGHVKFAHEAGKAKRTAGFKPLALKKVSSSAADADQSVARANADKVPLFSKGPFSIYGKCFTDDSQSDNPWVFGEMFIEINQGGAIFDSDDEDGSGNGLLKPSTPEIDRQIGSTSSAAGTESPGLINAPDASELPFYAAAGSLQINGHVFVATKVGQPEVGNGPFGSGNRRCMFSGTMTWK